MQALYAIMNKEKEIIVYYKDEKAKDFLVLAVVVSIISISVFIAFVTTIMLKEPDNYGKSFINDCYKEIK